MNILCKYLQNILAYVAKPSATGPGCPCQHTRRTPGGTYPVAAWGTCGRHDTTFVAAGARGRRRQRHRISRRRQGDTHGATPDLSKSEIIK